MNSIVPSSHQSAALHVSGHAQSQSRGRPGCLRSSQSSRPFLRLSRDPSGPQQHRPSFSSFASCSYSYLHMDCCFFTTTLVASANLLAPAVPSRVKLRTSRFGRKLRGLISVLFHHCSVAEYQPGYDGLPVRGKALPLSTAVVPCNEWLRH